MSVPIKGQKRDTLHLIVEDLAMRHLPSARIQRFRLALAAKTNDVFFFCHDCRLLGVLFGIPFEALPVYAQAAPTKHLRQQCV